MKTENLCALFVLGLALAACSKTESETSAVTASPEDKPKDTAVTVTEKGESTLLSVGTNAPSLEVTGHDGQKVKLDALGGKPAVVYFYPKDNTTGCTIEAQEIRDEWQDFVKAGAVVIGVSLDDAESHKAFAEQEKLPFILVPDTEGTLAKAFGVPIINGKAKRVTFVIGKDGKISKVFPAVTPRGHGKEILSALDGA